MHRRKSATRSSVVGVNFAAHSSVFIRVDLWFNALFVLPFFAHADTTWNYTVQISATVQTSPPQILLTWPQDDYGADSYTIYRKSKDVNSWGAGTVLPGTTTSYTDTSVAVGSTYEYAIVKNASLGYFGYGYIFSGIEAPLVDSRGKLILIVDNRFTTSLSNELATLQSDLTGDGWLVLRHDVFTNDSPANVRNLIISDYDQDPSNVKTVFLFGHVPILQSGNLNYDGHLYRPMPADAFYGDVDGDWSSSPSFLPSDVELMVGRVDMAGMVGNYAQTPWPSELEMLRNYLNKDHRFRQKIVAVPRIALMGDRRGAENGLASAASGYRNFRPLLGANSIVQAQVADGSPFSARWGPMLDTGSYLWAYGCGAGSPSSIGSLGTNGPYGDLYSIDVVGQDAKSVFTMLFGSWFANWDGTDNFMRAFLATPSLGLTCCLAGVPHWFVHHMGLGETIGYGARLSMNNSTMYQNQTNPFTRAVYIALMGDPSLRQDQLAPPTVLTGTSSGGSSTLNWQASADSILGYHVYRSTSSGGPYTRLTSSVIAGTSFTDNTASAGTYTYMVRAIALLTTPSGSYYDPSQGAFTTVNVSGTPPPINLSIRRSGNNVLLTWNSQPGITYRVLSKTNITQPTWLDITGPMTATAATSTWSPPNLNSREQLYRIASP